VSSAVGQHSPFELLRTLFKGGLFLRNFVLSNDGDIKKVISRLTRCLFPNRAFLAVETADSQTFVAHVASGFMAELNASSGPASRQIIEFISQILEQQRNTGKLRWKRGVFAVLVGLDGSGKTTVARKLCGLAAMRERFTEVRYFHWLPSLSKPTEFPLPDPKPVPRKPKLQPNLWRSAISIQRLFKNIVLSNLAYWLHFGWRFRRSALLLTDRYYYNYFLDPASVRYYGPDSVLNWARRFFPKPDVVIVFQTSPEILRSRKQELSEEEILRQNQLLRALDFRARQTFTVDASLPVPHVTAAVMNAILKIAHE
jgi:thymidylate kinase